MVFKNYDWNSVDPKKLNVNVRKKGIWTDVEFEHSVHGEFE